MPKRDDDDIKNGMDHDDDATDWSVMIIYSKE